MHICCNTIILLYMSIHVEPDVAPKACAEEIGYTYLVSRCCILLCLYVLYECVCVCI